MKENIFLYLFLTQHSHPRNHPGSFASGKLHLLALRHVCFVCGWFMGDGHMLLHPNVGVLLNKSTHLIMNYLVY